MTGKAFAMVAVFLLLVYWPTGATSSKRKVEPRALKMTCPLTEDVTQSKRSLVITHTSKPGDTLLGCDWLPTDSPSCLTYYNFTMESLKPDAVVVSAPLRWLQKEGSFHCQVVSHPTSPRTTCEVFSQIEAGVADKDRPQTTSVPSKPATVFVPPDNTPQTDSSKDDSCSGLLTAVGVLSIDVSLLLVIIIVSVVFIYVRLGKDDTQRLLQKLLGKQQKAAGEENKPMNGNSTC